MINDFKNIAREETKTERIKCQNCGKFISQKQIIENKAKFHYMPANQFSPEECYWECKDCS